MTARYDRNSRAKVPQQSAAAELAALLDTRDRENARREGIQIGLLLVLHGLPGADQAKALAVRLCATGDELDNASTAALRLLERWVKRLGGQGLD